MKKNVSNSTIERCIDSLKQYEINYVGQWIIGMPGENPEMALETLLLHTRLGDIPQVHIAVPFPKTRMYEIAVEKGLIDKNFSPSITSLYDDFLFHTGYEKILMRIIYNLFSVARMKIPLDFKDLDFERRAGRQKFHPGLTLGEMLAWNWKK